MAEGTQITVDVANVKLLGRRIKRNKGGDK
jgi:hypothetical protein